MWEVTTNVQTNDTQEVCVYLSSYAEARVMYQYFINTGHEYALIEVVPEADVVPYEDADRAIADIAIGNYDNLTFKMKEYV